MQHVDVPSRLNRESMQNRRHRLSRSSILILSGFLAGLASARTVSANTQLLMSSAAAAGLCAYLSFEHLARLRQRRNDRIAVERMMDRLERRLDRHIPRGSTVRRPSGARRQHKLDRQFLTVPAGNVR